MTTDAQVSGKGLKYVRQIEDIFSIITPLTRNTETEISAIDGAGSAVN